MSTLRIEDVIAMWRRLQGVAQGGARGMPPTSSHDQRRHHYRQRASRCSPCRPCKATGYLRNDRAISVCHCCDGHGVTDGTPLHYSGPIRNVPYWWELARP